MIIEKMKIEDYDDVHHLWTNTPGMGLNEIDDSKAGIEKYLIRNPETCFVARKNGKLLGAILSGHDGRRGYIHHAAVAHEARRKGIGKRLVEQSLAALREEGIRKAAFVVFTNNEDGNTFWDTLGFKERTDLVYRDKML